MRGRRASRYAAASCVFASATADASCPALCVPASVESADASQALWLLGCHTALTVECTLGQPSCWLLGLTDAMHRNLERAAHEVPHALVQSGLMNVGVLVGTIIVVILAARGFIDRSQSLAPWVLGAKLAVAWMVVNALGAQAGPGGFSAQLYAFAGELYGLAASAGGVIAGQVLSGEYAAINQDCWGMGRTSNAPDAWGRTWDAIDDMLRVASTVGAVVAASAVALAGNIGHVLDGGLTSLAMSPMMVLFQSMVGIMLLMSAVAFSATAALTLAETVVSASLAVAMSPVAAVAAVWRQTRGAMVSLVATIASNALSLLTIGAALGLGARIVGSALEIFATHSLGSAGTDVSFQADSGLRMQASALLEAMKEGKFAINEEGGETQWILPAVILAVGMWIAQGLLRLATAIASELASSGSAMAGEISRQAVETVKGFGSQVLGKVTMMKGVQRM